MSAVRKFPESKQIRQNLSAVGSSLSLFCPNPCRFPYTHNAQRTTHNAQRTTHNAQRTTHTGGLLFLRFFCPAIFTPHKFSVVEAAPGPVALRSLILISKVMQMMANGLRFR
jgi:hypothetical protein